MRVALKVRFECPHVTCILWNVTEFRLQEARDNSTTLNIQPGGGDEFKRQRLVLSDYINFKIEKWREFFIYLLC